MFLEKKEKADPSSWSTPASSNPEIIPPIERSLTCQSRIQSPTECIFDWVLKVLAVLSAILFGIWAPVSYRLQVSGNSSSDDATGEGLRTVAEMSAELQGVKREVRALAAMRAWEFCAGGEKQKVLEACQRLSQSVDINSLIAGLTLPLGQDGDGEQGGGDGKGQEGTATLAPTVMPSYTVIPSHHTLSMRTAPQTSTTTVTSSAIIIRPGHEAQYEELVASHLATATRAAVPGPAPPILPGIEAFETFQVPLRYCIGGGILCVVLSIQGWKWKRRADRMEEAAWMNGKWRRRRRTGPGVPAD